MQKVNDLLDLPYLSSEKPSVLMDNILSLWPDTTTKDTSKLLHGLFLHRLPLQMRSQLANYSANSPAKLAATTDAIWSQSGSQVSAAAVTVAAVTSGCPCSPSPHSSAGGSRGCQAQAPKSSSGAGKKKWPCNHTPATNSLCFYHTNFGALAQKCRHLRQRAALNIGSFPPGPWAVQRHRPWCPQQARLPEPFPLAHLPGFLYARELPPHSANLLKSAGLPLI